MAVPYKVFSTRLDRFGQFPGDLSDGLIGRVLPRASRDRGQSNIIECKPQQEVFVASKVGEDSNVLSKTGRRVVHGNLRVAKTLSLPSEMPTTTPTLHAMNVDGTNSTTKRKRSGLSRREQCRANQQRYRNKQRNHQLQLEKSVEQLRQELDKLKWRRRDLTSRERISHGPWTIVAEVFHLLETSFRSPWRLANAEEMLKHADIRHSLAFLRESFADDVSMGDLTGADALMEQLRRYSLYFGDPQIKLNRIEAVASGVMRATATLSVTVTDFTLRHVFPGLEESACRDEGGRRLWREQLVGARLSCECSMNFLFDQESGRVVRLESCIDLMESLTHVMESLEGVQGVMRQTSLAPECVIGESMGEIPSSNTSEASTRR